MKTNLNSACLAGLLAAALLTTVASAQNVGIGTTTPKSKLSVNGSTASGGLAVGDATYTSTTGTVAPVNGAIIQGFTGLGTTNPIMHMHLEGDGSANWDSAIYVNSNANPPTGTLAPHVVLRASNNAALSPEDIFGRYIVQSLPGGVQANATGWDAIHRGFSGGAPLTAMRFLTSGGAGAVERMRIAEDGNVGIGTTNPVAPLHILPSSGDVNRGAGNVNNINSNGGNVPTTGNPAVNLTAVSVFANGRVVSGSGFFAPLFQAAVSFTASDRRIKDIRGVSDSAKDLGTLQKLRVTDYTMKDTEFFGTKPFKKVIAQEVEEVFPQAVSKTCKSVPDVMRRAVAKEVAKGRFDIEVSAAASLKTGEKVEILNKDRTPELAEILAVNDGTITVGLRTIADGDEVLVYGRQVDDFGIVDYEALSMLNVSATQELSRQMNAKDAEITALKAEVAGLKTANAKLGSLSSEMDELKQAVAAIRSKGEGQVSTVSLTK